jgi:cystathionine gamma-synthase
MFKNMSLGLATRTIHGSAQRDAHGSPHTPIYNTTTFAFPSTAELLDVVDGKRPGALYTRYGLNPGIFALAPRLGGIHGNLG